MGFGERLLKYMTDHNLRSTDVQKLTGVDKCRVNSYIYCDTTPRLDVFVKLCKGLGLSADYLLGLRDFEVLIQEKEA